MSDLIQCSGCKGRKTITGLGNMVVDCVMCKGVGFITQIVLNEVVNKVEPLLDLFSKPIDVTKQDLGSDLKGKLRRKVKGSS